MIEGSDERMRDRVCKNLQRLQYLYDIMVACRVLFHHLHVSVYLELLFWRGEAEAQEDFAISAQI